MCVRDTKNCLRLQFKFPVSWIWIGMLNEHVCKNRIYIWQSSGIWSHVVSQIGTTNLSENLAASVIMVEKFTAGSSEMLVHIYQTMWWCILENHNLNIHHRKNLKFCKRCMKAHSHYIMTLTGSGPSADGQNISTCVVMNMMHIIDIIHHQQASAGKVWRNILICRCLSVTEKLVGVVEYSWSDSGLICAGHCEFWRKLLVL